MSDSEAERIAYLEQANKTLAHQLERRADGMDPLTQALRARIAELEAERERIIAVVRGLYGHNPSGIVCHCVYHEDAREILAAHPPA